MKKITLCFFIVITQTLFSQTKITENQKLAATCKVWGFLKYYHPEVAGGKTNWDKKLFDILPEIDKAQTKEEFSTILEKWVETLGVVPANKPLVLDAKTDLFTKNLDLDWIKRNKLFSKKLSEQLQFITENRFQGKNHYVSLEGEGVRLSFTNEIEYTEFDWTNKNMRILSLFRFWNYVEYFFPYKYVMDQKWDDALVEILPNIATPASEKDFLLAMRELSIKLNDTHAGTFSMKMIEYLGGEKYIAASVKIIDDKAVVTNLANDSLANIDDIKIGDIITKVNGKTVAQKVKELEKYMSGSNKDAALPSIGMVMLTGNMPDLEIEFIRNNLKSVKRIRLYENRDLKRTPPKSTDKWKILENNIGYVNMSQVEKVDINVMMEELKNTQSIIFDVRSRPKYTDFLLHEYLNPEPKPILRLLSQDLSFPGRYIWANEMQECGKINPDYYKGKVIVLVGSGTFSFGEQTAMAFQTAPNTTIIGSQTAGADGPNYNFTIINGFNSSFTSSGVFYPNKKETQRVGIVPNIVVKPTIVGTQEKKDEVLDRAIQFVNKGA
ncbi:S41 family peptidase [Flavobacterium hercynium]|uniref:Tail specific protease domain-containing protein n=1 Tax=Flavobacterium hercynium TaxID=387094 RepID=A0A226HBE2_9FLAO|nr:S41 family peptidase [Flavobacterium hercynium]OXA90961.1 hypothetical protein B0A66_12150 [Flavobacterium hercynium]SMP36411.1 C-terminal processing protease CtpA/Prc, contains a PDZ domain [Flavobacterium hercynium]